MGTLEKATLQELPADPKGSPGPTLPVQFNPTSLKLHVGNVVEGGQTRGKQVRQNLGKSSSTLSFELVFDTADEGTTDQPRSVRERTASVEKFVLPKPGQTDAPPRVRFRWQDLQFDGVIESLDLEFDLFASNGTPLRAKCSVTIKEQDPKYQYLVVGDGAKQNAGAREPGSPSPGAPGSAGGPANRSAAALGGEAAASFAARVGLDPSGWRGLSLGASAGASLSLEAGAEIGFSADVSVGAGLGVSVGLAAGASVSLDASFGLEVDASLSAVAGVGVGASLAAGFALSAAGGVTSALSTVQNVQSAAAADSARRAFGAPGAASSGASGPVAAPPSLSTPRPSRPDQPRTPLARDPESASPQRLATPGASPPAPPPPAVDLRASAFGFGVPLRPAVAVDPADRPDALAGAIRLKPGVKAADQLFTDDPTVPAWVRLPAREARPSVAATAPGRARKCACGARRPCGCASTRSGGK